MSEKTPVGPRRTAPLRDLPVAQGRTDLLVRVDPLALPAVVDPRSLFGDDRPVELEVGVGKGRFILLAASARPEVNFLGVERAKRFYDRALDRVAKRSLANVRLLLADATALIADRLATACLAGCHIYFPDPWPKKRHHKRRLFQTETPARLARLLRPGGLLRVVTDHTDYAHLIRDLVDAHSEFEDAGADSGLWELPGMGDYTTLGITNFEIKYRREGRPIHRFAWRRR